MVDPGSFTLARNRGPLTVVGGPCAGQRVADGGLQRVLLGDPMGRSEMHEYERRILGAGKDALVILALPGATAESVLGELVAGYATPPRRQTVHR